MQSMQQMGTVVQHDGPNRLGLLSNWITLFKFFSSFLGLSLPSHCLSLPFSVSFAACPWPFSVFSIAFPLPIAAVLCLFDFPGNVQSMQQMRTIMQHDGPNRLGLLSNQVHLHQDPGALVQAARGLRTGCDRGHDRLRPGALQLQPLWTLPAAAAS